VDTLAVWFFGAFRKTQDTTEWLVVPIIVGFSLVIGFLNAVFLGIGISTFVFVAAFFRVGIVKFHATGKDIRSRIERSMSQSVFLNENGDQIQVLVLQNYLFFGNAGKLCNYIATMFEEVEENEVDFSVPPMPKVVVIDFSLITGLDTSTVDIFSDIKETCVSNDCKIYLTGLSTRMRKSLALGGVKPESNLPRKQRSVRLFQDMDSGLGKAEDYIIMLEGSLIGRSLDAIRFQDQACMSGFRFSLKQIDELHCHKFAESLIDLEPFVDPLQLNAGEILFACDGGIVTDEERGLFFIESGMLKISRDSSLSLTLNRTRSYGHLGSLGAGAQGTLGHQHARIGSFARKAAQTKEHGTDNLRLARIGPGWVVGTLENASGSRSPGVFTAVTRCSLHRLPFSRLQELEETNPILVLQLYKMLSHLMARKQEITTEHLSTLHTIMSSPAYSKPPSIRSSLGSLSKGSQGLG
jgi:CRP-like cAMP-binding protein/anti-anti-sigma regulatory factor